MLFLDVFGDSSGWDPHRDDNNCEDDTIEGEMFKQLGVKEEDKDADDEALFSIFLLQRTRFLFFLK